MLMCVKSHVSTYFICGLVCVHVLVYEFVWSQDLEQPVKEDDADELVLCVSLTDDERQLDGSRQLIAAIGLG